MTEEMVHCPYQDGECPKLSEHISDSKRIERKVDIAIILIVALHGAEIIGILTAL